MTWFSRQSLAAESGVRSQVNPRGICSVQSSSGTCFFFWVFWSFRFQYYFAHSFLPFSVIYHRFYIILVAERYVKYNTFASFSLSLLPDKWIVLDFLFFISEVLGRGKETNRWKETNVFTQSLESMFDGRNERITEAFNMNPFRCRSSNTDATTTRVLGCKCFWWIPSRWERNCLIWQQSTWDLTAASVGTNASLMTKQMTVSFRKRGCPTRVVSGILHWDVMKTYSSNNCT